MMTLEQCNGNWNHMYEWKSGEKWYPCHVYEDDSPTFVGKVAIFTRNGTISHENPENVRKMSQDTYMKNRSEVMKALGPYYKDKGFHDMLHEDVEIWKNAETDLLYHKHLGEDLEH